MADAAFDPLDPRARADAARARLAATVGELKHRLSPGTIASETADKVRRRSSALAGDAASFAAARPGILIGAAAAIGLFLARKPLLKAVSKPFRKDKETARLQDGSSDGRTEPADGGRASEETAG